MSYHAKINNLGTYIILILLSSILVYSLFLYSTVFKPVLSQLATARASQIGQMVINDAVSEIMQSDDILEGKMVNIEKGNDGQIVAVLPNLPIINRLKSEIALTVQKKLDNVNNSQIRIPIGNLTGVEMLSNLGPRLPINLIPLGKTIVDFDSKFAEAGINQTRHQIFVTVSLNISLLMPNNQAIGTQIKTTVPMSETIIVGNVPANYTNIASTPEKARDDLMNLLDN
jgi:sporulation protein YunB